MTSEIDGTSGSRQVSGTSLRLGMISDIGLVALGVFIVWLYSSMGRPIWTDEYLHFALGDMDFQGVLTVVHNTTSEINHGQTGAYMVVNWASLKLFGANSLALRLPSLLAGGLLLFSAVMVIRLRGFARPWQYLVVLSLACQGFLMYFAGEARPYIVLAATAVATLAYYQLPLDRRRSVLAWVLLIGGVILGVVNHPYYPLMLAVVLAVSVWETFRSGLLSGGWRSLSRFINLPLLAIAGVLYLGVGAFTWLRGKPDFGYDPFENMGSQEVVVEAFWRDHLGVLNSYRGWFIVVAALVLLALVLTRFGGLLDLMGPVALGVLALLTSFAVSVASYMSNYWILERQWVAGIALFTVALVWLVAQVFQSATGWTRVVAAMPGLAISYAVLLGFMSVVPAQRDLLDSYAEQTKGFAAETRSVEQLVAEQVDWIAVANVNIARGEPVWPVFTDWYSRQAGMRAE